MKYNRYLILYGCMLVLLSLPFGLNALFLHNARENLPFKDVVHLQGRTNALYGTATNQNIFAYKLQLVKEKRPAILALGASTVLAMREEFFTTSFANCGNAMNDLTEGKIFLEEVLKHYKPELVIIGLSFWWFTEKNAEPKTYDYHQNIGYLTFEALLRPFTFLADSKITLGEYLRIISFGTIRSGLTNYESIGLRAMKRSEGFRKDGSAFSAYKLFGLETRNALLEMNPALDGRKRFEYTGPIAPKAMETLKEIVELLEKNRVKFVFVVTPVSGVFYKAMESSPEKYGYIGKLHNYYGTLPYEIYNFHNIDDVGGNDCECTDGIHVGDVLSQRIFLKILERNPATVLKDYMNANLMKTMVKEYGGRTLTIYEKDRNMFNYREVDFLKIGCKK